ncbi:hypothetical protein B9Z65_7444 [Elsinoe australis]|uniref:Uncharacterized protein n=1 Tax=Elsinoe australis TaxID=40998 RepID=A0A2P7YC93_9PEZI|nr:hypothetical protein B9Z65_7444 [Elsinoe australis]
MSRHFRSIRDDISQGDRDPRWRYCIAVDQQCLESVISGANSKFAALNDYGYVYLVDSTWGEEPEGEERELNDEDDEEPPIEGCVEEDIGVIKLDTRVVGPRWFLLMWGIGWEDQYKRIPERVDLT